jgi:hypothetical protein
MLHLQLRAPRDRRVSDERTERKRTTHDNRNVGEVEDRPAADSDEVSDDSPSESIRNVARSAAESDSQSNTGEPARV